MYFQSRILNGQHREIGAFSNRCMRRLVLNGTRVHYYNDCITHGLGVSDNNMRMEGGGDKAGQNVLRN